jgi:hypothetical protein
MKAPVEAVKEHWSTFWALVRASADAVRRQWRLAVFPVAAVVAIAVTSMTGLAAIGSIFRRPDDPPPFGVVGSTVLMFLGLWYLTTVILLFWSVALTSAALAALRGARISVISAIGVAVRRLPALLGFALLAATFGAALGAIERRSHWVQRALLAVFGFSWTLLSLFALTAMAGERLGTLDALRRGTTLLGSDWAARRLTTLGMGLLWVPLLALQAGALWLAGDEDSPAGVVAASISTGIIVIAWAAFWLLERVYVAAVYCYAVEGVVPASFAGEQFDGLWRAIDAAPVAARRDAGPQPTLRGWLARQELRSHRRRAAVALGIAMVLAGLSLGFDPRLRGLVAAHFPGAGARIDATNFPTGPKLLRTLRLQGEDTDGITSLVTSDGPRVFVFQKRGFVVLDDNLRVVQRTLLPPNAMAIRDVTTFEVTPGSHVLVGHAWNTSREERVVAVSPDGSVLFETPAIFSLSDLGGHRQAAGVLSAAPVRTPDGWGVAVGYDNFLFGLCFLDQRGQQRWCNRQLGTAQFTAALDCDDDGRDDIVSGPLKGNSSFGCYTTGGEHLEDVGAPRRVWAMRAVDLDGDGRKELTYASTELNHTSRFGIMRADGTTIADVHLAGRPQRHAPVAVRRTRQGPHDVVTLGPEGELVGVSMSGERWSAGRGYHALTVVDLDGDALDEIVAIGRAAAGREHGYHYPIVAWTWGRAAVARNASVRP